MAVHAALNASFRAGWRAGWPALALAITVLIVGNFWTARQAWLAGANRPPPDFAALLLADPAGGADILVPYAELSAFRARFPAASLRPPAARGEFRVAGRRGFYDTREEASGLVVTVHRTRYGGDPDGVLLGFDRFRYRLDGQGVTPERAMRYGGLAEWITTLVVVGIGVVVLLDAGWAMLGFIRRRKHSRGREAPAPGFSFVSLFAGGALAVTAQTVARPWLDPLSPAGVNLPLALAALGVAAAAFAWMARCAALPAVAPPPGRVVAGATRTIVRLLLAMAVVGVLAHVSGVARWRGASQNGFDIRGKLSAVMQAVEDYRAQRGALPPSLDALPASAQPAVQQLREQFAAVAWSPEGRFDLTLFERSVEAAGHWRLPRVERDGVVYWDWCAAAALPADWSPPVCADPRWMLIELFDSPLPDRLQANAPPLAGAPAALELDALAVLSAASPSRALIAGISSDAPHRVRLRLTRHAALPEVARGRELVIEGFRDLGRHEWSARREPTGLRCYLSAEGAGAPVTVSWDARCESGPAAR